MIIGVGTDILEVSRIGRSVEKFGIKFAERILHPQERRIYTDKVEMSEALAMRWLAKRFAQKEAVVKALGTGIAKGVTFHDVICMHDEAGKPYVALEGKAAEIADALGIANVHVSVSDEKTYVSAFAVASA